MRRDVFDDVVVIPPVIDKRELVEHHVHATERENMGMGQPPQHGYPFPHDLYVRPVRMNDF